MTKEELKELMKVIAKAYKEAGKEIQTATLVKPKKETDDNSDDSEFDTELLIDNRKPEDNN